GETVTPVHGRGLIREPRCVQRAVKPIAATIPGKDSPSTITAMRRRRQTDHQESRCGIAKTRHRLPPIVPILVALHLLPSDSLAMGDKTRAESAGSDLTL